MVAEGRPLTQEQETLIDRVVTDSSLIPDYYNPSISNPVKALVTYNNADAITEAPADYGRLWIQLGLEYPADYIKAFIDQTKGYVSPPPPDCARTKAYPRTKPGCHGLICCPGSFP